MCIPRDQVECGPGTTLNPSTLICEPDGEPPCGAGTTLNPDTGECESSLSCATGTTDMGGECVPDGTVICGDGTMFDATTGTCMATGDACGEGTVLIDGECRPTDEALMGDIFAGPEPDDPYFGGAPQNFLPPALGESTTIEGCIDPADRNGDDELDYDADWFAFSTAAAGLYRINADGLGGLAAGFAVVAVDGPLADSGWIRMGLNLTGDSSERRVYLPRGGNYALVVFDSRSINDLNALEDGAAIAAVLAPANAPPPMRAVGGGGTCYFVTMEAEATPDASPINDLRETGILGDPEFFSVAATGRTIFSGVMTEESLAADGGFVFVAGDTVSPSGSLAGGQDFTTSDAVADGSELIIVVDAVVNISLNPVVWTLDLDLIPEIVDDGTINLINDIEPPFFNLAGLSASQGEILHVTFTSTAPVGFVMLPPSLTAAEVNCDPDTGPCTAADFYFSVGESGAQVVQIIAPAQGEGAAIDMTFTVDRQVPEEITPGTPLTQGLVDTRTFFEIDSSAFAWSRMEFLNQTGTIDGLTVSFHMPAAGVIGPAPASPPDCTLPYGCVHTGITQTTPGTSNILSIIDGPNLGLPLLVEIVDPAGWDGDESVDITFDQETFIDITADPATPITRTGDATVAGQPTYYMVRGFQAGEVDFQVTGTGGADPLIDVLRAKASAAPLLTRDITMGPDTTESDVRPIGATGFIAYGVRTAGDAAVDITINHGDPPYLESRSTTPFVSICPSAGGDGVAETMPADVTLEDGTGYAYFHVSGPQTFHTDFPEFRFFDTPVTSVRMTAKGVLGFGALPAPGLGQQPDPIPTVNGYANDLVAPFWRDTLAQEMCFLAEADRFVAELNGEATLFEPPGTVFFLGTVQFQAILHASGNIEFVYGPDHVAGRVGADNNTAQIGLEDREGRLGLSATNTIAPDTSILWTPGS